MGCWRRRGEFLETDVCPSGRFGFRRLCALASLGIELLGSWSPNRAKYLWRVFHSVFFSRLSWDGRRIGKGGTGQFAKEVLGGKRSVCVWILCRELLLE